MELPNRFSCLTKELWRYIVSFLPLEDAVRTSALSKDWREIWYSFSNLIFKYDEMFCEGGISIVVIVRSTSRLYKELKNPPQLFLNEWFIEISDTTIDLAEQNHQKERWISFGLLNHLTLINIRTFEGSEKEFEILRLLLESTPKVISLNVLSDNEAEHQEISKRILAFKLPSPIAVIEFHSVLDPSVGYYLCFCCDSRLAAVCFYYFGLPPTLITITVFPLLNCVTVQYLFPVYYSGITPASVLLLLFLVFLETIKSKPGLNP
ncbi:hypothetical protein M9H77_28149 [Catharanthus roseus]|uniref:Uncharacterized protein n=1 Tax=Catharanthus roseus TaxID=4058 RepID=A0ACC0AIN0_CATRO|nr:hypothetical protein M9H77_28149 [Catharanthus roseus]